MLSFIYKKSMGRTSSLTRRISIFFLKNWSTYMEIKVLDTSNPTQLAIIGRVDTVTADEFLKTMEGILQEHPQIWNGIAQNGNF